MHRQQGGGALGLGLVGQADDAEQHRRDQAGAPEADGRPRERSGDDLDEQQQVERRCGERGQVPHDDHVRQDHATRASGASPLVHCAAVLRDRLQDAVVPAQPLAEQPPHGRRDLGPCACGRSERHPPARSGDGERQVGVLGEGVAADTTDLDDRLPTERTHGPGHAQHHAELVERPPLDRGGDRVLDVLDLGDEARPVADLRVAGDGADPVIREGADELGERGGLEQGVAVDQDHDVVGRHADPGVERLGLAAVGLPDDSHIRELVGVEHLCGAVGRAVVDDDDLDPGMQAGLDRTHRVRDDVALVVGRHDDGHGVAQVAPLDRAHLLVDTTSAATALVRDRQRQQDDGACRHQAHDQHTHDPEGTGQPADDGVAADQRRAEHVLGPRRRRAGRHAGDLRGRDELVAVVLQRGDQLVEHLDGACPVPAAVVERDDGARAEGRQRLGEQLLGGDLGVEVPGGSARQHQQQPVLRGDLCRVELRLGQEPGSSRVRRTVDGGRDPGGADDGTLGQRDLSLDLGVGQRAHARVGVGVVADLVAVAVELLDQLGMGDDLLADDEERPGHTVTVEGLGDHRGPLGVGAVVEGEGDGAWGKVDRLDLPVLESDQRAVVAQSLVADRLVDHHVGFRDGAADEDVGMARDEHQHDESDCRGNDSQCRRGPTEHPSVLRPDVCALSITTPSQKGRAPLSSQKRLRCGLYDSWAARGVIVAG